MKINCVTLFIGCIFLIILESNTNSQGIEKKIYHTAFTKKAPVIDGLMNDSCWNLVGWGAGFIQSQPAENKPPSQETAFKILYDNDNLYVFIRAYDKEANKISRIITKRDNIDGDMVELDIDSYFDKQTAFAFVASASGSKADMAISQDGNNYDDSWNPVWFLKSSIDENGWSAEIKIPFSQLRFGKKDEQIWGFQITRQIYRLSERSTWQFIPKGSPGLVHLFAELQGINNIKPKRQIELMPYTSGRIERFAQQTGNPFMTGKSSSLSAGLDGKVAITNDLTLDFSINPDFGQVEADPSEVNLTAFETYFSERRPFFVEGKNIYQFQPTNTIVIGNMYADNLFYSRRIGRAPEYIPPTSSDEFLYMPQATTIIAASKLSGKTKKGLSIGIQECVTANENAIIDSAGKKYHESVEPLTSYYVARVQQDFNKGESTLGGMFTAVNRDITNPGLDYMHSAAYTGGIDFQQSWKERTWYLAGNTEFSNVRGLPEAITNTQMASAHYFQRPDAKYLSVDSSLTSLSGYGGTIKFGKSSKNRLQFETSLTVRSPGLEFNDIGYMRYSDVIHQGSWAGYYIRDPFAIFNNFYLNTNYWLYWDFGGDLLSTNTNLNFNSQFKNRWVINGQFTRTSQNLSNTLLRGGPSFIMPGTYDMSLYLTTDQSKKLSLYAAGYIGLGDVHSYHANQLLAGAFFRPLNAISISFEPSYFIQHSKLQYVETTSYNGDPRYLLAELNQKTLSLTFRLNYTINPELTIEYYGQPFISAGKYYNYKISTNTHADMFSERFQTFSSSQISYDKSNSTYGFDENQDGIADYTLVNPDFNFQQFRSNLVIRWEYRPGSTIYLVWSQSRTNNLTDGTFVYGNDMRDLFNIVPYNVFLLKFSYWFSL